MKCLKCGFDNEEGVRYCINCGNDMNSTQLNQNIEKKTLNVGVGSSKFALNNGIIKIVIALIVILGIVIGAIVISKKNSTDDVLLPNAEQDKKPNENVDYSKYTADYPRSERNIDYYWNINVDTFDKSRFDGRISVFGTIMKTKLTGKTIKDAGFKVGFISFDDKFEEYQKLNIKDDYFTNQGILLKNNKTYPTYDDYISVYFYNYQGNDSIYADSTDVYFGQSSSYKDVGNVIVPCMKNKDFSYMNIDDIIDTLGVPKYVQGRKTKKEDAKDSWGITVFDYVYVYDDYTFIFNFTYDDKYGVEVSDIIYMGNQYFERPVEISKNEVYDSYTEFLENQQNQYLKAIGKK